MTQMTLSENKWALREISLLNWGSYDGLSVIPILDGVDDPFSGDTLPMTFVTGAGGSGKSTILDAMTVLMMPSSRRFALNRASNREGGDPRTIRDYVRGKQDLHEDGHDYLRHGRVISCIKAEYVSTEGGRFSLAKFFVMEDSDGSSDYRQTMVTVNGGMDLHRLSALGVRPLDRSAIVSFWPGAKVYDRVSAFMSAVCDVLGIPHDNGSSKALDLLNRIQAGRTVGSVDSLFKELVFGEPSSLAPAREICDSYTEQYEQYHNFEVRERLLDILDGIEGVHEKYVKNTADAETLDSLTKSEGAGSKADLWAANKQASLMAVLSEESSAELAAANERLATLTKEADAAAKRLDELTGLYMSAGGDRIDRLKEAVNHADERLTRVTAAFSELEGDVRSCDKTSPSDDESFAALVASVTEGQAELTATAEKREKELEDITFEIGSSNKVIERIDADIAYYSTRSSRIPRDLGHARDLLAANAGLDPSELPFVGEIVGVKKEWAEWETAVNLALKPVSTIVLVDEDVASSVRRKNDAAVLGRRLQLEVVDLSDETMPEALPESWVSSRLDFNEASPFVYWARRRLIGTNVDYECVTDASLLDDPDVPRITINGQVRRGTHGAIGRDEGKDVRIIGFSSKATIEDLESERADEVTRREGFLKRRRSINHDNALLRSYQTFIARYASKSWSDFDVVSCKASLATAKADLAAVLSDASLADYARQREAAAQEHQRLVMDLGVQKKAVSDAESSLSVINQVLKTTEKRRRELFDAGISLDVVEESMAEQIYRDHVPETGFSDIHSVSSFFGPQRYPRYLTTAKNACQEAAKAAKEDLEKTFSLYTSTAENLALPNVTDKIDSYNDYLLEYHRLSNVIGHGSADSVARELLASFKGRMVQLQEAYRRDPDEIRRRIEPINDILSTLDFSPKHGRLRVDMTSKKEPAIIDFRKTIDKFVTDVDALSAGDSVAGPMATLASLVETVKAALGVNGGVLDTRRLIEVKMVADWPDEIGEQPTLYNKLGAGSGAEIRELVSFIFGSALLYYLTGNGKMSPSYVTVLLDEAFAESDPEFTKRGIAALNGLGFQLVMAVPMEKIGSVGTMCTTGLTALKHNNRSCVQLGFKELV